MERLSIAEAAKQKVDTILLSTIAFIQLKVRSTLIAIARTLVNYD